MFTARNHTTAPTADRDRYSSILRRSICPQFAPHPAIMDPPYLCAFEFARPGPLCHKIEDLAFALLHLAVLLQIGEKQALRRSEEHTSELQSRLHLVCRLLLEKKKNTEERSAYEFTTQSTYHTS